MAGGRDKIVGSVHTKGHALSFSLFPLFLNTVFDDSGFGFVPRNLELLSLLELKTVLNLYQGCTIICLFQFWNFFLFLGLLLS